VSDNFVELIPVDPHFVPAPAADEKAVALLRAAAPTAGEVSSEISEGISFRDCGGNFERVLCPGCQKEIALEQWQEWMDEDFVDGSFRLRPIITPCCDRRATLSELDYDWPQGFSRYALTARNPGGDLKPVVARLEGVLGCKLRMIRQHL
jgi:hypothetical protein